MFQITPPKDLPDEDSVAGKYVPNKMCPTKGELQLISIIRFYILNRDNAVIYIYMNPSMTKSNML